MIKQVLIGFCCCIALWATLAAQPVISTRQVLEGVEVYADLKKSGLYYYAPSDLLLAKDANDKPIFQLVEMRYTGTACYGDQGDKHFLNLVQFQVQLPPIPSAIIKAVEQKLSLGGKAAMLKPLPLKGIQSTLVTGIGSDEVKKIGENGNFESSGNRPSSNSGAYWTERSFTLRLNNYDAQILWEQVTKGTLFISLSYAFIAEAVQGMEGDLKIEGDSEAIEQLGQSIQPDMLKDTTLLILPIKSNTLDVKIDAAKWPELLKKLDINEGVPPAYAALEVRCYDFSDDLRPDLYLKRLDIEATGVNGRPVTLNTQFIRSEPDMNARNIRFPYAIKMDKPIRYRITSFSLEGEQVVGEWKSKEPCQDIIDVTTPLKENLIKKEIYEIEFDGDSLISKDIKMVSFDVYHYVGGKAHLKKLTYIPESSAAINSLDLVYDVNRPLLYSVTWEYTNGNRKKSANKALLEKYYYISTPK